MPQSSSTKKHAQDSPDVAGPNPKSQRTKMVKSSDDSDKKNSGKKLKELEVGVPIVYGNIAFWLGKKASEYHHLKLYPEDESGSLSTKKPVVVESYDEVVLAEPSEAFFARVQNHPAVSVPRLPPVLNLPPPVSIDDVDRRKRSESKDHPLSQWFTNFSEADELLKLTAARQQVQGHIARLRRQLSLIEGQHQQLKPAGDL